MRLIDGDALKQTFCAECTHTLKCSDCDIDYHFEKLAPTIQRWIPCSERLPEPPCLIYDRNGIQLTQRMITIKIKTGEQMAFRGETIENFLNIYKIEQLLNEHNKVLAWMPLPEPYKGE